MKFNMKWAVIIGVLAILMIAMGRNPIDEARQERKKTMEGKDPLVSAIEEHNSGKNSVGFNPMPAGSALPSPTEDRVYSPPAPATPQSAPHDDYYPPPPKGGSPSSSLAPKTMDDMFKLPNGKRFAFDDTKVYTFDAQGKRVLLADGIYPVFGGKLKMVVENGERVGFTN